MPYPLDESEGEGGGEEASFIGFGAGRESAPLSSAPLAYTECEVDQRRGGEQLYDGRRGVRGSRNVTAAVPAQLWAHPRAR